MSDEQPRTATGPRFDPRLVGLNAALLAALAGVTMLGAGAQSPAVAQQPAGLPGAQAEPGGPRGRGEYTMISGRAQGTTADVVYIVDGANQDLIAMQWNSSAGRLEGIGYRSLSEDARYLQRPR